MTEADTIAVFVNPLQLLEVDEPWASLTTTGPIADDIFNFLCTPGIPSDVNSLASRYKEVSQEKKRLFVAPNDPRILEKLVWPLRHAKASYIVGNFLSTIALCGMVSEMMALFLFELAQIDGIEVKSDKGVVMTSESFESEGQQGRVKALRKSKVIEDDLKSDFDYVRTTRRRYLHLWSQDHASLKEDGRTVFQRTVDLVVKSLGLGVNQGKVIFKSAVLKYLQKGGVYKSV